MIHFNEPNCPHSDRRILGNFDGASWGVALPCRVSGQCGHARATHQG